jgi:uncharacterized membrane-anchored protein
VNTRIRFALFVVVALVQLAVAGGAIYRSEMALRNGEVFRFRVQPVDPVDAFRGRYVAIRFEVDRAPAPDDLEIRRGRWIFAPVVQDAEGFAYLGEVVLEPPADGSYLRFRTGGIYPDEDGRRHAWVTLPFGRYYMDEELAQETERELWRRGRREAWVTVRLLSGTGVIEDLWVEGLPVRQWLAEGGAERPPSPTATPDS